MGTMPVILKGAFGRRNHGSVGSSFAVRGAKLQHDNTMKYPKLPKLLVLPVTLCSLAAYQLQAADSDSHWILRGDIGPTFVNDVSTSTTDVLTGAQTSTKLAFQTGYRMDLETGYQFSDAWTLEGEFGYIDNSVNLSSSIGSSSSSFYQVPILFNCIYTLPLKFPLKPYIGAGLGVNVVGVNKLNDYTGAGQLTTGIKFNLGDRIDLGLGYKLLATTVHDWNSVPNSNSGSRTIGQAIVASFTYKF